MPMMALLFLVVSFVSGLLGVSQMTDQGMALAQLMFWGFLVLGVGLLIHGATHQPEDGPAHPMKL